jgi:hypothetical protein
MEGMNIEGLGTNCAARKTAGDRHQREWMDDREKKCHDEKLAYLCPTAQNKNEARSLVKG